MEEADTSIGQQVKQVPVADLADAIRLYADRLSTGENKARTTSDTVHTQRDNEGRHTQSGNNQAVHQPGNEANDQANSQAGQHHNEQWRAAAQAVKNANKQRQIKIANFDAPQEAINDLNNGAVDLVIAQKPAEMGSTAVQYGVYALTSKTSSIQKRVATGYVVIDKTNVNDPASQAAIYKS